MCSSDLDRAEACAGEFGEEMSPRIRGVGEAVQAEREWTRTAREHREVDAIRAHHPAFDARCFGHGKTLVE